MCVCICYSPKTHLLTVELRGQRVHIKIILINIVKSPFSKFPAIFTSINNGSDSKESACNVGDLDSISGLGRCPGEGNGNPLQYSCLENSMDRGDRGAWWATVRGSQRVGHSWATNTHMYISLMCMNGHFLTQSSVPGIISHSQSFRRKNSLHLCVFAY